MAVALRPCGHGLLINGFYCVARCDVVIVYEAVVRIIAGIERIPLHKRVLKA